MFGAGSRARLGVQRDSGPHYCPAGCTSGKYAFHQDIFAEVQGNMDRVYGPNCSTKTGTENSSTHTSLTSHPFPLCPLFYFRPSQSISSSKYERTPPPPTRDISDVKVTLFGSSASDDGSGSLVSISTGDDGTPRHRAKTRTTTVKVGGGGGGDGSAPSSPLSAASGDADDDDDEEYDDDDDDDEEYADDDDAREEDGAGATGAAAAPAAVPAPRADVPADVVDAAHFMTSA